MVNATDVVNYFLYANIKLLSIDIFDTVIARSVSCPRDIFILMQKNIEHNEKFAALPEALRNGFPLERIKAEAETRRVSKSEEISLNSIYECLAAKYLIPQDVILSLIDLESESEMMSVCPIHETRRIINEIRARNKRIVFVSDMYLPATIIKKMLIFIGSYQPGDGIYVSSEYGLSKASGNLYSKMLELENCKPNDVLHIGDNKHSDVLVPRSLGIRTMCLSKSEENRYENVFSKSDEGAISKFVAGAMRGARLMNSYNDEISSAWYELGCDIAGPILLNYVTWVLKKAAALHLKRLYFLSRDGQVLLNIAERIVNRLKINIELRYLYGSRQAWHLASTTCIDDTLFKWLFRKDPVLTLEIIAERSGQNEEDLARELQRLITAKIDAKKSLSDSEISLVKDIFYSSMKVSVLEKSAKLRDEAISYFKQEGLFENEQCAIVDLGWHGALQHSLRKLFNCTDYSTTSIIGFYFGLYTDNYCMGPYDKKIAYFFSPELPKTLKRMPIEFINVLEILATADHGTTFEYYFTDRKIKTLTKPISELELVNIGKMKILREGLFSFLKLIPEHYFNNVAESDDTFRMSKLIRLLMDSPEKKFANALGDFKFSCDQTDAKLSPLAPPVSVCQAFSIGLFQHSMRKQHFSHWVEASRQRSSFISSCLLSFRAQKNMAKIGKLFDVWNHE